MSANETSHIPEMPTSPATIVAPEVPEKLSGETHPVHTTVHDLEKFGADSPSAASLDGDIDPVAEKKLLRKLDWCIFPVLYVIYAMSFLDRINISNAKIQGLTKDIDLSGERFNIALFMYFIPYILLEVPSNMLIRYVRPSWYLAFLMFAWGVIDMCMGFVNSYGALVGLRVLLGIFEAGVLPGMIYLTSMYYKRHEYQKRMSVLFSSTLVAGAFGGLLAYGIADIGTRNGYKAWRWIFIIEGAFTAFAAFIGAFLIVDWPEQCKYLNAEEKALLKRRLELDTGDHCKMDTLNSQSRKLIFSDYKIWLGSFMYMGIGTTGYATTYFMPTILLEFGWSAQSAQVHTIPVYVVSAVGMLSAAWLSDRIRRRYIFILVGCLISTIGYGMLLGQTSLDRSAKYAAVFLICLGGYIATPIILAWLQNNLSGHWKRSFGSSFQVTLGNIAGIIASNIFLTKESPTYHTGYGVSFGMLWMGLIAATAMFFLLKHENKARDAGKRDDRLERPPEEVDNMGDYHPSFRFTL